MEVKNQWKGWLYLAPALILLAVFTFYPFFKTILISFMETYDANGNLAGYNPSMIKNGYEFTFKNFYNVQKVAKLVDGQVIWETQNLGAIGSRDFSKALLNTSVIALITVPGSTIIALLISVALNSIKPFQKLLQTIYFLPYVTNSIAIGMVFAIMFEVSSPTGTVVGASTIGIMNEFFGLFGINPRVWTSVTASWGSKMTVACVYGIWNALPFKIMILLGALQSVNKQYYDAAKVDCASRFTTFRRITIPMLSPMLSYVLITGFIGAFKEYSSLIGLFGDNLKDYGMQTIVGLVYQFLETSNYGKASAFAIILFGIILVFTVINLQISKKKVHY